MLALYPSLDDSKPVDSNYGLVSKVLFGLPSSLKGPFTVPS